MKILIEEEVVRQTLDALIDFNQQSIGGVALPAEIDTAIDALRTALEAAEKVRGLKPICWISDEEAETLKSGSHVRCLNSAYKTVGASVPLYDLSGLGAEKTGEGS